jgi:hypothetical protein
MLRYLTCVLAFSLLATCGQASAPATPIQTARPQFQESFNEKADAKAAIRTAIETAAADGIRVLIVWGSNDDKGSTLYLAVKRSQAFSRSTFFTHEYKNVNVDVGRADRNLGLAKSYGAILSADELPALTVLDSAGRVIANVNAAALRPEKDPAGIDPVKVAAFLKSHQAAAPDAVALFDAAVKQAKKEHKRVFVWFSAPW